MDAPPLYLSLFNSCAIQLALQSLVEAFRFAKEIHTYITSRVGRHGVYRLGLSVHGPPSSIII